jgi:hypothetical protein
MPAQVQHVANCKNRVIGAHLPRRRRKIEIICWTLSDVEHDVESTRFKRDYKDDLKVDNGIEH